MDRDWRVSMCVRLRWWWWWWRWRWVEIFPIRDASEKNLKQPLRASRQSDKAQSFIISAVFAALIWLNVEMLQKQTGNHRQERGWRVSIEKWKNASHLWSWSQHSLILKTSCWHIQLKLNLQDLRIVLLLNSCKLLLAVAAVSKLAVWAGGSWFALPVSNTSSASKNLKKAHRVTLSDCDVWLTLPDSCPRSRER